MTRCIALLLSVALAGSAHAALCTANAGTPVACPPTPAPESVRLRITRDDYGVPHIKARSLYEVGYNVGVAQAQDRLFQMEFTRKSANGTLAEVAGRDALGDDQDTRRQFYSEEERASLFSTLSCDVQQVVQGFVDGVNAWVDQIYADQTLADVPHEFFFLPTVVRFLGNFMIPSGVRYTIETIGGTE